MSKETKNRLNIGGQLKREKCEMKRGYHQSTFLLYLNSFISLIFSVLHHINRKIRRMNLNLKIYSLSYLIT